MINSIITVIIVIRIENSKIRLPISRIISKDIKIINKINIKITQIVIIVIIIIILITTIIRKSIKIITIIIIIIIVITKADTIITNMI